MTHSPGPRAKNGLSAAQAAALTFAERAARSREPEARARLDRVLRTAGCAREAFERVVESVRSHARVVVHFHPDRYGSIPVTVTESLLRDGRYRNQFETGLSSGSRSAFPGGSRDRWERELFGGAYHEPGVLAHERPKYGSLELIRHPDGPAPRFGSCYGIPMRWHCGFRLAVDMVPDDFRGPAMQPLGRRIAPEGVLDAAVIGVAEASLHRRPQVWENWGMGTRDEILQHLKQLWHVLVHYGSPAEGIVR